MSVCSASEGTISTSLAGWRKQWCRFALHEACAVPPVGRWKTLFEGWSERIKGSWGRPAVDVAPVSLIPDGMVPSSTMALTSAFVRGPFRFRLRYLEFSQRLLAVLILTARGSARHILLHLSK